MGLSKEVQIIIIVGALIAGLLLSIAFAVYFCFLRKRNGNKRGNKRKPDVVSGPHYIPPRADNSGPNNVRLDKLPTGAHTKRMEEGRSFVEGKGERDSSDEKTTNYIMGPAEELSGREVKSHSVAMDNGGFVGDNQVESGTYMRDGVDPADVAEAYMKNKYMREATRTRQKNQLDVRRQVSKNRARSQKKSTKSDNPTAAQNRPSERRNNNNKQRPSSSSGRPKDRNSQMKKRNSET